MGTKITVDTIANLDSTSALETVNDNFDEITVEFDKVIYKDGSVPMSGNLDMNSKRIYNLADAVSDTQPVTKRQLVSLTADIHKGDPGPAFATFTTIAGFTAAPITNKTQVLQDPSIAFGVFNWETVNAPYTADGINTIKADSTALSVGAWVRQKATGITANDGASGSIFTTIAGFITKLMSSTGSAIVGFLASGTGAVSRAMQDKGREIVSAKDFATGNGSTNDITGLSNAVSSLSNGGLLSFPKGQYATNVSLDIFQPISLQGQSAGYSVINPKLATSADNTVTLVASTTNTNELQTVEKLTLGDPATGSRVGLDGLLLLTNGTNKFFPKMTIREINVGSGSGWAIHHSNTSPDPQGGMYGATIENNILRGGINQELSGDSINIIGNIISGSKLGIQSQLIPGASLLAVERNNITSSGGAVRVLDGSRGRYIGNNTENFVAGAGAQNGGACWSIVGSTNPIIAGVVKENLIAAFAATTATKLLYLQNCRGTLVADNTFLSSAAGVVTDIEIGNTCVNVRIGSNAYNRAGGGVASPVIVDNGIGTIGVVKTVTLANSWVENGTGQGLRYLKGEDGYVRLRGRIKSGTATDGIKIGAVPVGFRPSVIEWAPVVYLTGTGYTSGQIAVDVSGDITAYGIASATSITVDMMFPAAGLANTLSPE